mgnify:CR=1 FL=1
MLNSAFIIKSPNYICLIVSCLVLTACGGGGSSAPEAPVNNVIEEVVEETNETPVDDRTVLSTVTLTADGNNTGTNTYDIIQNVLAVGSIESPDLYSGNHQGDGQHIIQGTDEEVGHYFIFLSHRDLDKDRDKDYTDRQRNEIKAYDKSVDALKAFEGETLQYSWKFKILSGMELSSKFSHFFQLKAVNASESYANGNDSQPIITISGAEKSDIGNALQVRHNAGHDIAGNTTSSDYIYQESSGWNDIAGEWVEVIAEATFSEQGTFKLTMTRLSDEKEIININKSNIDMWRGNEASDFVRPKWGIYRSIVETNSLRADEEQVFFTDFSIKKLL